LNLARLRSAARDPERTFVALATERPESGRHRPSTFTLLSTPCPLHGEYSKNPLPEKPRKFIVAVRTARFEGKATPRKCPGKVAPKAKNSRSRGMMPALTPGCQRLGRCDHTRLHQCHLAVNIDSKTKPVFARPAPSAVARSWEFRMSRIDSLPPFHAVSID
jgi:hypothetical protein